MIESVRTPRFRPYVIASNLLSWLIDRQSRRGTSPGQPPSAPGPEARARPSRTAAIAPSLSHLRCRAFVSHLPVNECEDCSPARAAGGNDSGQGLNRWSIHFWQKREKANACDRRATLDPCSGRRTRRLMRGKGRVGRMFDPFRRSSQLAEPAGCAAAGLKQLR